MMAASCITFFVGASITTSNLSTVSQNTADPAKYCKSGEKLATPQPRNTLATPGKDFSTLGFFYCVDDAGHQRDITSDVMGNAFGQMFNVLPTWATASFVAIGLFCLGLPILIVGAILSLRSSKSAPVMADNSTFSPSSSFSGFTDNPSANLTDRLAQLDKAYKAGLLSDDEYQRARQQIIDGLGS